MGGAEIEDYTETAPELYGIWHKTCKVPYFDEFAELPINTLCLVNKIDMNRLDGELNRVSYYKDKKNNYVDCGQLHVYQGKQIYEGKVYMRWQQLFYDNGGRLQTLGVYVLTTVIDLSEYGVVEIPDLTKYEIE